MKHPHAELMDQYLEDWKQDPEPWKRWQIRPRDREAWVSLEEHPKWRSQNEYRRKPSTIRIGDMEVPEPVRNPLEEGQRYWAPCPFEKKNFAKSIWYGDDYDMFALDAGMVHLNREAAEQHARALIKVSGGEV